ncbi:hypothetical protein EV424DRAFT_1543925 [Suillus variegatus]|nr:hypothetical protein EV424DRAFT_1543925 [Suillus variegatus]
MEKMNLNLAAISTFCNEKPAIHCPYPTVTQASYDKSKLSSPSNSPPSNSPPSSPPSIGISESRSMVSEEDDNFPVTPDSKRSGGKHCPTADISHHRESGHTSSTPESKRHAKLYHPYPHRRLLSGDRYHDRAEQILRRQSCHQYSEGMSIEDQEALSRAIRNMSPHTFHCAIHYKEAVRETLRMEYLYRGWLLETSRRLTIFDESLHHETEMELGKADQELQWLVHVLVDRGGSPRTTNDDVPYITAARESSGQALVHADAEIAAQIQLNPLHIQRRHISMQRLSQSPGQHDFLQPSHLPLPSGLSWYPGAAAMQQAPMMFTPFPTFGESHQGDDLPPPISFDHPLPGAAAMRQAPMFTAFPTFGESAAAFTPLPTFDENHQSKHWPSSVPFDHAPSPTLDDYNGTLLPPFIVPSQNPICLNDLASPPSALADYRRNFPPPLLSMDGVTMLPPAAPDYIRPQPLAALKHPRQRTKPFKTPSSTPSSTTPSHPTPTQSMQPQIDLPPLDYQSNLPIHDAFILAAEKELISDAVNNCTMIKPSLREGLKDEETGQWMAFEHDALLDVVLGVVRKLKYWPYIQDLDNLYCTAAAAIYCILMQFSSGKLDREIEFLAESFKFVYDLSKQYIANVIQKNEKLAKQWSDVKARTMTRLADIV